MTTRFWWVRHGPTYQNTLAGWRDVAADLSDKDRIEWLRKTLPAGRVYSSDLRRAVDTATALEQGPPAICPGLRETHFGQWEGLSFQDIMQRWPELSRSVWERAGTPAPPDGESWNDMSGRVVAEIEQLQSSSADIIIVAHHGPILAALAHATKLSPAHVLSFSIAHLSVTRLDWIADSAAWRVGCVNQQM